MGGRGEPPAVHQPRRDRRIERWTSGVHIPNPVGERLRIDVLEQVTGRTGRHRREDLRVVREAREHEHAHPGCDLEQPADGPDPVTPGHHQVEQDHVGRRRAREPDGFIGAGSLADHLDAVLQAQERTEPLANHRVVVDDDQADRCTHLVIPSAGSR